MIDVGEHLASQISARLKVEPIDGPASIDEQSLVVKGVKAATAPLRHTPAGREGLRSSWSFQFFRL